MKDHGMKLKYRGIVKFCRCMDCVHDSMKLCKRRPSPRERRERGAWVADREEAVVESAPIE